MTDAYQAITTVIKMLVVFHKGNLTTYVHALADSVIRVQTLRNQAVSAFLVSVFD